MSTSAQRSSYWSKFRFPYDIVATSSRIGEVISTEEWAEMVRIPHRRGVGHVDGALARKILGINGKSWSPDLFRDPAVVIEVGREAMRRAGLAGSEIDALIVVTCTPYEIQLDQDSFRFLRELGVPDHVPPLQISAGCAGIVRAAQLASRLDAENVLILSYNLPSCYMVNRDGQVNPTYQHNSRHPFADILWASAGIFSDAAGALVLRRNQSSTGIVYYSRDSLTFGDGAGFEDPLVHFPGGGALNPIGFYGSQELACYGMHGQRVKEYYAKGMILNHRLLCELRPGYADEVSRIYTHQASPALVSDFLEQSELPLSKAPSNARELGNLVTPCTVKLLDDDVEAGRVQDQDEICFSVVGAGPERGVLMSKLALAAARQTIVPPALELERHSA